MHKESGSAGLYLAPLDGLRLVAFLAVFVHHLPAFTPVAALTKAHNYGWVGVELFFSISSLLFFHLLSAEAEKTGDISVWRFYARRFLRIWPLMVLYPALVLLFYGIPKEDTLARLAAMVVFLENFVVIFKGPNNQVPWAAHLWTLSFEFQVYLLIPFAFIAYRRYGKRAFLLFAAIAYVYCFTARMIIFANDANHPIIWVTSFLRPESILAGICLSIIRPRWHWAISAATALLAGFVFCSSPLPWQSTLGAAVSYPAAALMCASLVDAALRCPWMASLLSAFPVRGLGRISYGLYVFHIFSISFAHRHLEAWLGRKLEFSAIFQDSALLAVSSLVMTVALATASYFLFEMQIDKLKRKFEIVHGRGKPGENDQSLASRSDSAPAISVSSTS